MRLILTASALWASLVAAALSPDGHAFGNLRPDFLTAELAQQALLVAGHTPNISSSVQFPWNYDGKPQQSLTWRLNVTDLACPDRLNDLGLAAADYSLGRHLVTSHWEISGPSANAEDGGEGLEAFLGRHGLGATVNTFVTRAPPNPWRTAQVTGNCTGILSAECIISLKQAALMQVKGRPIDFGRLQGCGVAVGDGPAAFTGQVHRSMFDLPPPADNQAKDPAQDGKAISYFTTLASKDRSTSSYNETVNALNVLVMSFRKLETAHTATLPDPLIVCQIADHSPPPAGPAWYENPIAPMAAGVLGLVISRYVVGPRLKAD